MFRRATPLFAAMFLVACGGGADDPAAGPATSAQAAPVTTATTAGTPAADAASSDTAPAGDVALPAALQFSAPLVGGGDVEFGPSAGRPVLLWFWAPW